MTISDVTVKMSSLVCLKITNHHEISSKRRSLILFYDHSLFGGGSIHVLVSVTD